MPFFKILLLIFFILVFAYSLFRPFPSILAKIFFISGSFLGMLSVAGTRYSILISDFLGMREADLYLYLTLLTVFLFVGYTLNRFDELNKKISFLVKEIAILNNKDID